MLTLSEFLRSTPAASLRAYFTHRGAVLPTDLAWEGPARGLSTALLHAVDAMSEDDRSRTIDDAERIGLMADGPGQSALYAVVRDDEQDLLDGLENGHARAVWAFVAAPATFEFAEQVRYADASRYGRSWSGYIGEPGRTVARDEAAIDSFRTLLRERLRSRHVEVEVCDRTRATLEAAVPLTQVTIYQEGRAETRKAFVAGALDRIPDHPVIEAALTYEPRQGVIEVVAPERDTREPLVRLFAEHLLGSPISGDRVRLRQFDLSRLLTRFDFPTDPEDNIEFVKVQSLRLMPIDTAGERITLECLRGAHRSIWSMAAERFGDHDPLAGGYRITQARLSVRFRPVVGVRGERTLGIAITMPEGCNLKERTTRQRLIGEKYLPRWGFVQSL